jgi:hypothetical protein
MRIPQTPDRVKEAPVHALRAMFAGVGQALLLPGRVLRRGGHEHVTPVSSGEVSSSGLSAETAPDGTAQTSSVPAGTATATATLEADHATVPAPRPAEPRAANPAEASTTAQSSTAKASSTKAASAKAAPTKAAPVKTSSPKASTAKTSTAKAGAAKTKAAEAQHASPEAQESSPEASAAKTAKAKAPAAKTPAAKTSTAKTSTPKSSASKATAAKASAAKASTVQASTVEAPAAAEAGATTVKEEISKPAAATAELPIPNYPDLTIASLRARMRGLDVSQLGTLLDYERSHDGRENVITMFERRIVKLQDEGSAAS